jgi:hypothetical protein
MGRSGFLPAKSLEETGKNRVRYFHETTYPAGVVKLVDALDSKSSGPCAHVGSIPTSGTKS